MPRCCRRSGGRRSSSRPRLKGHHGQAGDPWQRPQAADHPLGERRQYPCHEDGRSRARGRPPHGTPSPIRAREAVLASAHAPSAYRTPNDRRKRLARGGSQCHHTAGARRAKASAGACGPRPAFAEASSWCQGHTVWRTTNGPRQRQTETRASRAEKGKRQAAPHAPRSFVQERSLRGIANLFAIRHCSPSGIVPRGHVFAACGHQSGLRAAKRTDAVGLASLIRAHLREEESAQPRRLGSKHCSAVYPSCPVRGW